MTNTSINFLTEIRGGPLKIGGGGVAILSGRIFFFTNNFVQDFFSAIWVLHDIFCKIKLVSYRLILILFINIIHL